jgi:microcystin-dependent protein
LTNQQAAIVSFAAGAQFDTIGGGTTPVYNAPTAGEVAGGGGAHQNMQPSLIANKLIKR